MGTLLEHHGRQISVIVRILSPMPRMLIFLEFLMATRRWEKKGAEIGVFEYVSNGCLRNDEIEHTQISWSLCPTVSALFFSY